MVRGVKIDITGMPSQTILPISKDEGDENILEWKIGDMLEQGVIEEASEGIKCFVSHLFLRPKKDGDFRPILNLSKLNKLILYRHFKMEQLGTVMQLVHKGAWLASIDLTGLPQPGNQGGR